MDDDAVANFVAITGASDIVAQQVLEIAGGDLAQAATLYFDNPGAFAQAAPPPPTSAPSRSQAAAAGAGTSSSSSRPSRSAAAPSRPVGREDASGVIHLDSDDDDDDGGDDVQMIEDDADEDMYGFDDDDQGAAVAATVARSAQEEEDAAMAKRLQEELYAENAGSSEGVRAPIARTTETLVAPSYGMGPGDDQAEIDAAILDQLRRRRQGRSQAHQIFSQNVWDAGDPPLPNGGPGAQPSARQARLADLYRPPTDLIAHLDWDDARADGREDKKWILVNIQDMANFDCQILNRDIWKDEAVRDIVRESFIFLQYNKEDPRASQYIQYYLSEGRHENPDNYPHVAIVDPRTGEQVKVWSGRPFPEAMEFHAQLVEFLDRYSLAANSKNPVATSKARQPAKDVGRMTEEEMLNLALQNSLETANGGSSRPSIHDPDELTAAGATPDSTKGKERAAGSDIVDLTGGQAEEAEEPAPTTTTATNESAFAKIPTDQPHEEPANNPATTTRIQFRHSGGRVIRRFAVADPVVRIYEWLKASPLEDKSGVEFELKVMPEGRDLIQELDKTVEEAGLKQGTVMIEFIEE